MAASTNKVIPITRSSKMTTHVESAPHIQDGISHAQVDSSHAQTGSLTLEEIAKTEAEISDLVKAQRRYEMPIELKQRVDALINEFNTTYNDFYPDRQPLKEDFRASLDESLKAMGYSIGSLNGEQCYMRPRKDTRDVDALVTDKKEYFEYHLLSEKACLRMQVDSWDRHEPAMRVSNIVAGSVAGTIQVASIVIPGALFIPLGFLSAGIQAGVSLLRYDIGYDDTLFDSTICRGAYSLMKKVLPEKGDLEGVVKRFGIEPFAFVKYEGTAALKKALVPAKGYEYQVATK